MAKSINSFIVRLADQSAFRPQLTVAVKPVAEKKGTWLIRLLNPNTKEEVHNEEFVATAKTDMDQAVEAMNFGKKLLEQPKFLQIQFSLEYKEQIFITQGKRGKMKLKTVNSEEAIAEREAKMQLDYEPVAEEDIEESFDGEDSVEENEEAKEVVVESKISKKEAKPKVEKVLTKKQVKESIEKAYKAKVVVSNKNKKESKEVKKTKSLDKNKKTVKNKNKKANKKRKK